MLNVLFIYLLLVIGRSMQHVLALQCINRAAAADAPLDHISTPKVYLDEPSRISGARYHLVAT